jgi:hypothetical protein
MKVAEAQPSTTDLIVPVFVLLDSSERDGLMGNLGEVVAVFSDNYNTFATFRKRTRCRNKINISIALHRRESARF